MTTARHRRKLHFVPLSLVGALAIALLAAVTLPVMATTTEYIVVDPHTGLAIGGYDPVAYFTDGAAKPGRGTYELNFGGAVWRFRNEGNRAAFEAHPDVYMPRFGGYDPVDVARGIGVAGNPLYWLINGERLYLFYTEDSRTAFAVDVAELTATADRKWPSVQLTLSP